MNWKRIIRVNYAQILFVCGAFALMVVIGSLSVSNVIRKKSLSTVTVALNETEKTIRAYLREPKIAFDNIYTAVQDMLDRGQPQEAVRRYLTQTTSLLRSQDEGVQGFHAVYGYIRDEFIGGIEGRPGRDYIPQRQPWYQLAIRSENAEYTAPYVNISNGGMVISLTQRVYGKNGDYYGILVLDVNISWLMDYAESLQFTDGGYGMITNQYLHTIAHPREQYRNIQLRELGNGYAEIADMLRTARSVTAERIRDFDGTEVIVFFKQLYNGWFVGVIMPISSYFSDLYFNIFLLAALGIVLALILNYILIRLSMEKIQSEEESKSKSSFLARMSHEIRTPMNAIIGMAELELREDIPSAAHEHIITIKQSGANLLSIINDILDFSKIESGKLEIVAVDYLFASLVNDVLNIIRMRVMNSELQFVVNIDCNIPNALLGDEPRIRQILLNLLSNSVKYTEKGFVSLSVTGEVHGESAVTLIVKVEDSGKGIKPENMEKLFGDFVQFDTFSHKGVEGTGLGLAITRSLVMAMGGDISVCSEYGAGSTFTATLPQAVRSPEKLAVVQNPEKKKVLIYERRGLYADSLARTLENLGVSCAAVSDDSELHRELATGTYTSVFAAHTLYENVGKIHSQLKADAGIVLLAEFGSVSSDKNLSVLAMPVYSIPVANMLNGAPEASKYSAPKKAVIGFTARDASILIVDDIDLNLKVAGGLLRPYQMRVDLCKSGLEAIEAVRSTHYDLVFMDQMMPEMDGIEATKRIRALDLENQYYASLPIVALTANAVSGTKEMFLQNGFSDFLSKPIDPARLNALLVRWIPEEKRKTLDGPLFTGTKRRQTSPL